jgi:phage shock protein PspC (stress-responsive transcriptional regulator)
MKRLYRKEEGKMICGVCNGIADYFKLDPTLIRLVWAIFGCMGGGVLAYIIAAIIIPSDTISIES